MVQDFKKNVAKCNGGQDFDQDMLEEIYHSIKYVVLISNCQLLISPESLND